MKISLHFPPALTSTKSFDLKSRSTEMNPRVLTVHLGNSGREREERRREEKNQKVKVEGTVSILNRNISFCMTVLFL